LNVARSNVASHRLEWLPVQVSGARGEGRGERRRRRSVAAPGPADKNRYPGSNGGSM